jgi:hypothetical protein
MMNIAQLRRMEAIEEKVQTMAWQGAAAQHKFYTIFPDQGPLGREFYPKHLEFFRAGKEETERCFMAGNRVGKTEAGAYEMTCHLTGCYPHWWEGRRFLGPIKAWAAGDTHQTVRDILQEKFLGPPGQPGTGMIPGDLIQKNTHKAGTAEAVDTIYVRHAAGGMSRLTLKSYQGWPPGRHFSRYRERRGPDILLYRRARHNFRRKRRYQLRKPMVHRRAALKSHAF